MDFTSVYLVEQRHHNECVEDDGEMLRWLGAEFGSATGWYVQHFVTNEQQRKDYRQLVDGLANDVLHHGTRYQRLCTAVRFPQQQVRSGQLRGQRQRCQRVHNQVHPQHLNGLSKFVNKIPRQQTAQNKIQIFFFS